MLNPEREHSLPGAVIQSAVEIAEMAGVLPAVPTVDWCDRAAACIARLGRSALALVLIGSIDDSGRIIAVESVGVAPGPSGPERARGVARPHPRLAQDAADEGFIEAVRARAAKLSTIGWVPDWPTWPGAAMMGSPTMGPILAGRNWRTGPIGRIWGEPCPHDLLIGLSPLGDFEAGRIIMVQVAPAGIATLDPEAAAILRAVLPVLVRRALLAIGPRCSHPAQWLTTREQAVLDRLALGKSVKQIAEETGRSPHTVHDHVKSLHRKLNATSRGELIARALGHLGSPAPVHAPRPPLTRPWPMPA